MIALRGSLDCTLSDPTNLEFGYKFKEIVKFVDRLPQGSSLGATYVLNKDFWAGLSAEDRRTILDLTGLALARAQVAYQQGVDTALKNAAGLGVCDDGMVIDLSPINYVRVDPSSRTVLVGAGAKWADVDHATHKSGQPDSCLQQPGDIRECASAKPGTRAGECTYIKRHVAGRGGEGGACATGLIAR